MLKSQCHINSDFSKGTPISRKLTKSDVLSVYALFFWGLLLKS